MSTTDNYGTQRVSIDFKLPLKGSYFTEQLYSIVKPGVYKGLEVSIAANNVTGYQVDITKGQAFLNCVFESETKRSVKVQFQSNVKSYNIPQSASGLNEIIYLVYEYKEIVENWVAISHIAASGTLPDNAIVLAECSYDNSGNIINVSYNNRQYGLFNSDDNYSINDDNIFSNISDSTKKFRFSASGISGTDVIRVVNIPDHDYTLNTINDWIVDTTYKQNEVVLFNKTLYRCLIEHTASDFFSDLNLLYWENMTAVAEEEIVLGYNNTGLTLLSGKVIKVSGDFPSEKIPEVSLISDYLDEPFGVVIDDILTSNSGELIQRGRIQLLSYDFSSGVAGQKIYCDNTGSLTLSVTPLIIGQLLDPINSIIYVAILPAEEGLDVINFNGQLSVNENSVQKAFDRIDDYGYIPVWMTSKSYRVGNAVRRIDDGSNSAWICITNHNSTSFNSDISNWVALTDSTVNSVLEVNQVGHGLSLNDYVTYDKVLSLWIKANLTSDNAGAIGFVDSVVDVDNFTLKAFGSIVDYTGVAGDYYYTDENGAGTLTNIKPANIIQEILFAIPNNKAIAVNRPTQINLKNTVYVTINGNDVTGNGSITKPYKTIQHAIDNCQVNSTIVIDTGVYTENLTITDGIRLIASSYHSVTILGKLTINNTLTNNAISFQGIDFQNGTDHTIDHISSSSHNLSFYECNITQTGSGAFNALNVTALSGDSQYKNTQISCQDSSGGSRAIFTDLGIAFGMTLFDCLIGVEDNDDSVAIELNGNSGFIFVGKNINGQILAQGDGLTLVAYSGMTTSTVPVIVTLMPTQPTMIINSTVITSANPCVTGTGLFLYANIFFFNGAYLDYASTLSGGAGAQAFKSDNAVGMRYRNLTSGLTATNIQDAIDELATGSGGRTLAVNQVAHGFTVNDEIMYDKTTASYLKANTMGIYAVGTIAKVKTVVDADNFILYASGNIITRTGLTAGEFYYAKDDGTGGITLTPPTNVIQAVLFALPSNKAIELQYPAMTPSSVPTGIMPIGAELFFENSNPDTPTPSTEFVQANGQVISDALSPYNGKRIRNLNGATITGIAITALDDTLKTFTVSLNDVYALMVGDSLTPDVSVPNAVIKSVDYTTGVIEIGDFTLWSSGSFGLTGSSLAGATTFDTVGLKRFTRGNSANIGGGGVNTLQGHSVAGVTWNGTAFSNSLYPAGVIPTGIGTDYSYVLQSDGVNGTPRTGSETSPNYAEGVWLKKIK